MLGPEDEGHRVVVRRRVGDRDGRPIYSDALGDLVAVDASALTVRTKTGLVRVARGDVVAAKRIPPPRTGTAALERIASDAWPAAVRDRLGDWQLRATAGWTGRANSALPVGDPGRSLPDAVDAVVDWYAAKRLPARINVPLPLAAAVDAEVDARGWSRSVPVLVQTAPLAGFDVSGAADVLLSTTPSAQWLALVAGRKGDLPPEAHDLLTGPSLVRFATGYQDGTVVGTARGAVVSEVLHLGLVEVAEQARRQGMARRLTRALAGWARDAGAHTVMLQVEQPNEPALALYAGLGFRTHHTYVTRTVASE